MAELIALIAVVAVVVLAVVAVVGATARRRSPHDQAEVTDTRVTPPVEPGTGDALVGSSVERDEPEGTS